MELPFWGSYLTDCMKIRGTASYVNVPPMCARLIEANLAGLVELKNSITLEEAYQLDEILTVKNYHQWLGSFLAKQDAKNGR